ncbi:TPA: ATP-dependent DNA helicase PcrA [Candidatus Nomurabacteria bacterium]|nr:MAG: ATP-dependent DNA helicase PcrA [Parcubacteria bacterium RAAC4_OD1_1]HCY26222.1 ATP-dependent DNA helicase PcrA [Candidatus Nomurabacteria bacterium]
MDYLDSLNEKQKEAVLYTNGPLLIVAGAGAGKTKTITHRIIHLIHKGIDPETILAITFTNKAAKEMKERVMNMLEKKEHGDIVGDNLARPGFRRGVPFISTFHSLGVYIIKENAHLIGLTKHFSIIDESDALSIIKNIMKERDIDPKQHEPRKIKGIISRSKGDFIDVEEFSKNVGNAIQSIVAIIWRDYERELKKQKALDFDDLLIESVKILKNNKNIKEKYQNKWRYLHIDEYQDTNEVQYEMVKLLVDKENNLCVVGDTDQNIYSWRGANIKNMLHFEKDFPDAKIVMLEQNYRSTKNIIEAANNVIKKNEYRVPKNLFTENKEGESISICETYDELTEANHIAETIDILLREEEAENIAVLYRANFQSRVLEEAMLAKQIPYQVLGVKFFERKEIKDLLSYIKASLNKESLIDIKRIINVPTRGIGKTTITKLFANQFTEIPKATQEKINNFYNLLDNINEFISTHKVSESIKYIIEKTGLEEKYKHGSTDEQEDLENMKELVSLALKYDELEDGIEKLLEDASLSSDQDTLIYEEDKKGNKKGVRLMTVHASKGLEFKYVFITGLEQDLFPHIKDGKKSKEDNEEERRLFYVAITRAKHKLYLSYATLRTIFGMKQVNSPSEFIYDIPEHLTSFEQKYSQSGNRVVYL